MNTGDHNLAVVLDGNIARRLGITDEELFTRVTQEIRKISGVKNVYAYSLEHKVAPAEGVDLKDGSASLSPPSSKGGDM